MTKIAITGHTRGLGKSLHALYPDALVFSRSNGFNINDPQTILMQSHQCDIFINNTHDGFAQTKLLYMLHNLWKHENKTIINISSTSTVGVKNYPHPYSVEKAALDKACEQLRNVEGNNCNIVCIKAGYIDTPRVQKAVATKSNPDDVAQLIKMIIDNNNSFTITDISIAPK